MPIIHDLDHLFFSTEAIVNEIRFTQKPPHVRSFPILGSQFWKPHQRLSTIHQVVAKSDRRLRIIGGDKANDLCQSRGRSRGKDYFSAHRRMSSRTRSIGMPLPASSSAAACCSDARRALSSASDSNGSCCEWSHAERADFSFAGSF